jgi:pimeloyl-ACP methyl ester carboxylesterase
VISSRSAFLGALAAFSAASAVARPAVARAAGSPTVVLVHGELVGRQIWDRVTPLLAAHQVVVAPLVELSMRSLKQDVAALREALRMLEGPILLVGHSYGGAVISGTAGMASVRGLVYVAGLAPDEDETAVSVLEKFPRPPSARDLIPVEGGFALRSDRFIEDYGADLQVSVATKLRDTQIAFADGVLSEPAGRPAWKGTPAWYVISKEDGLISPEVQAFFAARMHAGVVTIEASHAAPLSHPSEVAAVILRGVRAATTA